MNFSSLEAKVEGQLGGPVVVGVPGVIAVPIGIPPGLEILAQMNELVFDEFTKCYDCLPCVATIPQVDIKNTNGEVSYLVGGQCFFGCCCCRCEPCCCRPCKILSCCEKYQVPMIRVQDKNRERDVIYAYWEICLCELPCSKAHQTVYVDAPDGTNIGSIQYQSPCCLTKRCSHGKFVVKDTSGEPVLFIKFPPCCECRCECKCGCDCCNIDCCNNDKEIVLDIFAVGGSKSIGTVRKKLYCWLKKCLCNPPEYTVDFPGDLDVKAKAILLVAPFFIDWMLF